MLIRTCRNRTTAGNNTCIQPIRLASYPEVKHLSDENMTVVHQGEDDKMPLAYFIHWT